MKAKPKNPSELFDAELSGFQEDLRRIVGKHRLSHHHLTVDELVSEINLALLKKKEDIIESFNEGFSEVEFKKIAYGFARNSIGWSQGKLNKNSYIARRNDYVTQTEDGPVTSFDMACESVIQEEETLPCLDSDSNDKCAYILKMIKDYCHILTEQEMKVLTLKEEGFNLREIAARLGVTHQAISVTDISIREKVTAHLNINPFTDNSSEKVTEGKQCLSDFFSSYPKLSDTDRKDLTNLLLSTSGLNTGVEISKIFRNGRFTSTQIYCFCARTGLSACLKRISRKAYTLEEEKCIIQMAKDGLTFELILRSLDRKPNSLSSKLRSLVMEGRIPSYPLRSIDLLSKKDKKILKLFKSGRSTSEIASEMGTSVSSMGSRRSSFAKKGLIPYARVGKS